MRDEARILGIAALSSAATFAALTAFQAYAHRRRRNQLSHDVQDSLRKASNHLQAAPEQSDSDLLPPTISDFDDELIREFLARNYAFLGDDAMARIRSSTVVVVGAGGVGSWAALMLLRSGVSNIRIIDFDLVSLSSLNRHAVATLADVGTPKVTACKAFFARIAPWATVDARIELWKDTPEGYNLLKGADWVVDAIDNITTKIDLLAYCHSQNIKVFAAMGAGAKCDPTRIQISDISDTQDDPLARAVRRRLRLKGILSGIPVVYSTEPPGSVKLLPLPDDEFQKGVVHELSALDDFRIRILPVLGPLPSIFGLNIATYIVCALAGQPIPHPLPIKNRKKLYEKLHKDLVKREAKRSPDGLHQKIPIDENDVAYIFEDLHRGRSTIPPHPILPKPLLVRWDSTKPLSVENCVVLSPAELETLETEGGGVGDKVKVWHRGGMKLKMDGGYFEDIEECEGSRVVQVVERRIAEARRIETLKL